MPDKKKKKLKVKQKQTQKQTQNVVINVGTTRQRSTNKPRQQQQQQQPQQQPSIIYRDNNSALVNSFLSDKTRENAITKLLMEHSQIQQQKRQELPKPSVALYNTPLQPSPEEDKPSFVSNLINKSNLFNQQRIPDETTNKPKPSAFDKLLMPPTPPPPVEPPKEEETMKKPKRQLIIEEDDDNEKAVVEQNVAPLEEKPQFKPRPTTPAPPPPSNNMRFTLKGLPQRRSQAEKAAYADYMREVIANKPENERTKAEKQAYNEYTSRYGDYANDTYMPPQQPLRPPTVRKQQRIVADTEDKTEDDEDLTFFSPLKQKPT